MLLDINHVQANRNMKHYYKTLKHKTEFKWAIKNNSKTKQTDMHIKLNGMHYTQGMKMKCHCSKI